MTSHIWPEEPRGANGVITASATIELVGRERFTLWFRIPESNGEDLPGNADHFVTAAVFPIMEAGGPVRVHGQVSPSLLRNITEFQGAWSTLLPYLTVSDISADDERESESALGAEQAIVAFSGGVDSCFTAYRHSGRAGLRFPSPLTAGLMVHGFDIPLSDPGAFSSATEKAESILSSLGLELIPIATNYREVVEDWNHSHGAAIASCLRLLGRRFSEGLIGQTFTYAEIRQIAEGVNALTDPLLSSDSLRIIPDGAAFHRSEKIDTMREWDEFLKNARVCWQGPHKDRNCCVCEKCIRNILTFRALGLGLPECFRKDVPDSTVKTFLMGAGSLPEIRYAELPRLAAERGSSGPWSDILRRRLVWRGHLRRFRMLRLIDRVIRSCRRRLTIPRGESVT